MSASVTCIGRQGARETHALVDLLAPADVDAVAAETYRWIKALRRVAYDGVSMRERFTYRGASLWWFTELYLHKTRELERAMRTIVALESACARCAPARLAVAGVGFPEQAAARAFAQARGLPIEIAGGTERGSNGWWPAYRIGLEARLSRLRPAPDLATPRHARVAAFVHTAFWREASAPDSADQESYVGPVLAALRAVLEPGALACVGVGPRRNFRARRWWDPILGRPSDDRITPIERLAPRRALEGSLALWRQRNALAAAVVAGPAIREAAIVRDCDLWPVLRQGLEGAARLQWPWSARAMDEAAAALEAIAPEVAVTYAEAGGWGRALVLEARRLGVPSVGLQHGFIYRHWLNYRHEPDEIAPLGTDAGFPCPDRTLLFDGYAARYLAGTGRLPRESLAVTGSPKLDALQSRVAAARAEGDAAVRRRIGVPVDATLLVLTSKFTEIRHELPELVDAVASLPGTHLAIKTHPAETAEPYRRLAGDRPFVTVVGADADLAALLAAADAVVTMNSTVAVDALVLGVPAVTIGLPNNLSPFVEAGAMAGAHRGEVRAALEAVLYDRGIRRGLIDRAARFADEQQMRADGHSAARAADAILSLARGERTV